MSKKLFTSWVSLFLLTCTFEASLLCQTAQPAGAQSEAGSEAAMFIGGRRRGRRGRSNYYNRMAQQQARADAQAQKKAAQAAAKARMASDRADNQHAQAMAHYKTSDFIKEYHPNAH